MKEASKGGRGGGGWGNFWLYKAGSAELVAFRKIIVGKPFLTTRSVFVCQMIFLRPGVPRTNNHTLSKSTWFFCFAAFGSKALVPQASPKTVGKHNMSGSL